MVMIVQPEPSTLAHYAVTAGNIPPIATQIYEGLVTYDWDQNPLPQLATSWESAPDGKSITFKLRPNVRFHDGTDCDAAAVKWNYDRILDEKINAPVRSSLQPPLKSVDVVDKTTLRFNLDQPWRPLIAARSEASAMGCR